MRKLTKAVARTPILGHAILAVFRVKIALRYFYRTLLNFVKWLFKSKETTNFMYDLEENNRRYLAIVDSRRIEPGISYSRGVYQRN